MPDPANTILEMSMMYAVPRCLHVIAELGVADALGDDPRTAADLASSTGANAGALARALRLVSAYGIFQQANDVEGQKGFAHTPASRLLRTDHPQSMRSFVRMMGNTLNWKTFELLALTIRTGNPATEQVSPGGSWAFYAQHPDESRLFDEAMTGKAHGQIAGILANYDFSPFQTIADIGGGRGHLLRAILDATPNAAGVLFDQPHVVKDAAGTAPARMQLQGGDFFNDALPVCDAYLIMQVIHDWNDEESVRILSAIRRSAPAHAKLLLIEAILPEDSKPGWIEMLDIFMLTLITGKERTRREFENLLASSGFKLDKVIDVGLGTSILEASAI
ncbi:MAG TPA: methyltransferase [Bryobacteraceae bacterium]|nr:methyltransferase [Bryobacteraceae bacterium]